MTRWCTADPCGRVAHNGDLCGPHLRIEREGLPHAETVWVARRLASVERSGDCLLWTGRLNNMGYGIVGAGKGGRNSGGMAVHRWFYERFKGPIPDGLVLDHLCRTPRCVNVDHLEPVTLAENTRRGFESRGYGSTRTHCAHGHPWTAENISVTVGARPGTVSRKCRICKKEQDSARHRANRQKAMGK